MGLTYGSLAIDDNRCVSNEIECLAHEYYDVFTIPCAFFFSGYFAPSQSLNSFLFESMLYDFG
jgi:hypothetical protein